MPYAPACLTPPHVAIAPPRRPAPPHRTRPLRRKTLPRAGAARLGPQAGQAGRIRQPPRPAERAHVSAPARTRRGGRSVARPPATHPPTHAAHRRGRHDGRCRRRAAAAATLCPKCHWRLRSTLCNRRGTYTCLRCGCPGADRAPRLPSSPAGDWSDWEDKRSVGGVGGPPTGALKLQGGSPSDGSARGGGFKCVSKAARTAGGGGCSVHTGHGAQAPGRGARVARCTAAAAAGAAARRALQRPGDAPQRRRQACFAVQSRS